MVSIRCHPADSDRNVGFTYLQLVSYQFHKMVCYVLNLISLYFVDAKVRPDAILLFGVSEMSTKDVFDYFQDYIPGSIEWIDDVSCMSSLCHVL